MSYVCRIFAKDIQALQDVKEYSLDDKDIKFVSDDKEKVYSLKDTEYVVIPTDVFKDMIDSIHANGEKPKNTNLKPKKNTKADIVAPVETENK